MVPSADMLGSVEYCHEEVTCENRATAAYHSPAELGDYSEIDLGAFGSTQDGFHRRAFRNMAGDRIVLAIAGTDNGDLEDCLADGAFLQL